MRKGGVGGVQELLQQLRIAGAVVAPGQVEVEQHRQVVQHPEGGVVEEIAVREGQPVQGPEGLVGRVLEAGPNTARVLLLTDPQSIVPVRRLRDGLPALAAGRGDGLVDVRVIDTDDAHFKAGDVFVSSGSGGIFGPGVLVARALRGGAEAALAKPFARPDAFDIVSVRSVYAPPPLPAPAPTPGAVPQPTASAAPARP